MTGQPEPYTRCRVCGCTDDACCIGGCSWREPDLCSSCVLTIPVVTTDAVKEEHLRHQHGLLLVAHPYTDMRSSFMVKLPDHAGLLQCGSYEIRTVDRGDGS